MGRAMCVSGTLNGVGTVKRQRLLPLAFGLVVAAELGTLGIVIWVGGSSSLLDLRLLLVLVVAATIVTGVTLWFRRLEPSTQRPPAPLDRWHTSVVRPRVVQRSIAIGLVFGGVGLLLGIPLAAQESRAAHIPRCLASISAASPRISSPLTGTT
jgi:hypothetical protein